MLSIRVKELITKEFRGDSPVKTVSRSSEKGLPEKIKIMFLFFKDDMFSKLGTVF